MKHCPFCGFGLFSNEDVCPNCGQVVGCLKIEEEAKKNV